MKYVRTTCPRPLFIGQNTGNRVFPGPEPRTYVPENVIRISPAPVTYVAEEFRRLKMCLVQCVCVFSSHSFWTSGSLDVPAGLGGRKTEGQQAIKDENGNLLRDKGDILRRWERFFGNLLNTKSFALQPSTIEKVQQRRKAPPPPGARSQIEEPISLEAEPTYAETQKAVRAMANWKAPGADSLPVEILKLDDPTRKPVVLKHFHAILVRLWRGEEIPQEWKDATIKVLHKFTRLTRRQRTAEGRRQSP